MKELQTMMRRCLGWAVALVAVILMSPALVSCSSEEDDIVNPATDEALADYTVMFYGVADCNMEDNLKYNLDQLKVFGYSEKVNFTGKVKFFGLEHDEEMKGTRLLTMTPEGMQNEQVAGSDFRMDNPQNLADFIVSSRERFPAKKYVLVLWGGGNVFDMYDQPASDSYAASGKSRSMMFDDNFEEEEDWAALSIFELEEALKRTGEKLDLLYWDTNCMNMIDQVYQLRNHVDYILASEHIVNEMGGNYTALLRSLEDNADVIPAMQDYTARMKPYWASLVADAYACDLTLVDVRHAEEAVQCIKRCADALIDMRDSYEPGSQGDMVFHYLLGDSNPDADVFYSEGGVLYFPANEYGYSFSMTDVSHLFQTMGDFFLNGTLSGYATQLDYVLDKLLPVSAFTCSSARVERISLGIFFPEMEYFLSEYDNCLVDTMNGLYEMLDFEKVVNWSRFLEKNKHRKFREVVDENGNVIYGDHYFPLLEEVTDEYNDEYDDEYDDEE